MKKGFSSALLFFMTLGTSGIAYSQEVKDPIATKPSADKISDHSKNTSPLRSEKDDQDSLIVTAYGATTRRFRTGMMKPDGKSTFKTKEITSIEQTTRSRPGVTGVKTLTGHGETNAISVTALFGQNAHETSKYYKNSKKINLLTKHLNMNYKDTALSLYLTTVTGTHHDSTTLFYDQHGPSEKLYPRKEITLSNEEALIRYKSFYDEVAAGRYDCARNVFYRDLPNKTWRMP